MESLEASEKRRIVDLIKEGKDGGRKSGNSMDWMYSDKKTNTDDYLLGKKIDKHFEKGNQATPKEDDVFGERIKANIALDMQAKIREDPLYAIKKREEESRRKILHNPVKMKELQKLIAQQKKEKKKMKKKKHKHSGLNDDDDLVQQYLSILTQKHGHRKGKGRRQRSASSDSSDNQHRQLSKPNKKGRRQRSASSDSSDNQHRQLSKPNMKGRRQRSASSDSSDNQHRQLSKPNMKGRRQRSASSDNQHRQLSKPNMKGRRQRSASSDPSNNQHRQLSKTNLKGRRQRSASSDSIFKQNKTHRKGGRHHSESSDSGDKYHRQQSKTHRKGRKHCYEETRKKCSRRGEQNTSCRSLSDQSDCDGSVQRSTKRGRRVSYSQSPTVDPTQERLYGLIKSSRRQSRSKSRSCSPQSNSSFSLSKYPSSQRIRSPHSSRSQQYREQSHSPRRKGHQGRKWSPLPSKRKVDKKERERQIQEMIVNAKWREDQRKYNVNRYKEEDQLEEEQRKEGSSADFLNPLMSQHATNSTVEDRLRRNKNNIQRTKAALDKDFTRH